MHLLHRDLEIASLRTRAAGAAIDLLLFLTAFGGCLAAYVAVRVKRRGRDRDTQDDVSERLGSSPRRRRIGERLRSKPAQVMIRMVSVALAVPMRNWRSPGARIVGLRVVDARTGGPVTVRSVILGSAVDAAFGLAIKPLTAPGRRRSEAENARLQEIEPQTQALRRQHAGDRRAERKAIAALYKANGVNPLRTLGSPRWLFLVLPNLLTAMLSSKGQTLRQRVSGTVVVRAR
jgi:hypothetical protein